MKQKWYFGIFVLTLVLLGYSRQQVHVPNQEIVVQFLDAQVTTDVAQNAISKVKKQLHSIGIFNIQVRETAAGRLKITYYSDLDIASVKGIFSEEISLELGYTPLNPKDDGEQDKFPLNKSSNSYDLNVCEIQTSCDAAFDLNGYGIELTLENKRLYNPVLDIAIHKNNTRGENNIEKTAYLAQRNTALALKDSSPIIPEVRAGPELNTFS